MSEPYYKNPDWPCFGQGLHHVGACPGYACPYLNDCVMEHEAGSALIIEWEQIPPKCFGSGGHQGSWQNGSKYDTCSMDFCDYFPLCTDGTIEIEREVDSGLTSCVGKWKGCTWLDVCPDVGACEAIYNRAIVIVEERNFSCFGGCGADEDPCKHSPCEYENSCWDHVADDIDGTVVILEEK